MVPLVEPDPYGTVIFYEKNGDFLEVFGMLEEVSHTVSLPLHIHDVHQVEKYKWIVTETKTYKKYLVARHETLDEFVLQPITEGAGVSLHLQRSATSSMSDELLSTSLNEKISSPNRVVMTPDSYASLIVRFPELTSSKVYTSPLKDDNPNSKDPLICLMSKPTSQSPAACVVNLPGCGQVVRTLPTWKAPEGVIPRDKKPHVSGLLEVTDLANHKLRYIPVPGATRQSPYTSWMFNISVTSLLLADTSNDGLVTVDVGGCVRLWETGLVNLERSLTEWQHMIGWQDTKPLQLNR